MTPEEAVRPMNAPRLLIDQREAAERLGLSAKLFRREVESGNIRFVLIGKRRRFTEADLEEFIERKRIAWPAAKAGSSTAGHSRRIGTMISPSQVVGFAEAVKRTMKRSRKLSQPKPDPTPSSAG